MIDFDDAGLDRYLADDPGGPVVMLNLLRFRPGGAETYLSYAEHFATSGIDERYGLEVLYGGHGTAALVADAGQEWDMVVLVRYPSRRAFVDMVRDPDYRRFDHLRRDALVESVLQPTVPLR